MKFAEIEYGCEHGHAHHFPTMEAAVKHFDPGLKLNYQDFLKDKPLLEATYKDIMMKIDPNFLAHRIRADLLKRVDFQGMFGDTLYYEIESSEFAYNGITYTNRVRFPDWNNVGTNFALNSVEAARAILWKGDIELHCTCPSFIHWGFQYLLTQINASIVIDNNPPVVRNPLHRGIVCKHLNRVLRVLPFYSGVVAKAIKDQFRT